MKKFWIPVSYLGNWKCPMCEKDCIFSSKKQYAFCPYCGTELFVRKEDLEEIKKWC